VVERFRVMRRKIEMALPLRCAASLGLAGNASQIPRGSWTILKRSQTFEFQRWFFGKSETCRASEWQSHDSRQQVGQSHVRAGDGLTWLQRLSSGETFFDVVPPFDLVAFVGFPAKQDDAAITHRGKIDQTLMIILQLNAQAFQLSRVS
jgi:hypothetical protein